MKWNPKDDAAFVELTRARLNTMRVGRPGTIYEVCDEPGRPQYRWNGQAMEASPTTVSVRNAVGAIIPADTTSSEFQAAHDAAVSEGKDLDLSDGIYTITDPVVLRPGARSIKASRAVIDCSNMSGTHAIHLDATSADSQYGQKQNGIHGLHMIGPGRDATPGLSALYVHSGTALKSPRPLVFGGYIEQFPTALDFYYRAYLAQFYALDIGYCALAINQRAGVDSGENIMFNGGAIFNTDQIFQCDDDSTEIFFNNVSLDYFRILGTINNGQVWLNDSHIELNGSAVPTNGWANISGNGAVLNIRGGRLMMADYVSDGPFGYDHLFNISHANAHLVLDGVLVSSLRNTSQKIVVGTGAKNTKVRNTKMYGATSELPCRISADQRLNVLIDGDMEDAGVSDGWQIYADTAAVTDRLSGANIGIAKTASVSSSGTQSLALTKEGGSGTSAVVELVVPLGDAKRLSAQFQWLANGVAGSVSLRYRWGKSLGRDGTGREEIVDLGSDISSVTLTPGASTWASQSLYPTEQAPEWATHLRMQFVMGSMGAGTLNIDDVIVNRW